MLDQGLHWRYENSHIRVFNFYPIFIPLFGRKVSGVSVQRSLGLKSGQFDRN